MNAPGEIARLAKIVEPDVAVITNIGRAHAGGVGGIEGVAREKASLLSYLRAGGCAVTPAGEPLLADYLKPVPHVVSFGTDGSADLRLTAVEHTAGGAGLTFEVNGRKRFALPMIGKHNALNALAAIAAARRLGLDDAAIEAGLASAAAPEMRLARRAVGPVEVFDDTYNASPESMLAAIDTFYELTGSASRRVLVLGDMLELGESSAAAHDEVGRRIAELGEPGLLVTVGAEALHVAERVTRSFPRARVLILSELDDEQARRVANRVSSGDAVLVKGSRRLGLERVVRAIRVRAEAREMEPSGEVGAARGPGG